jgi:hypothetical protein
MAKATLLAVIGIRSASMILLSPLINIKYLQVELNFCCNPLFSPVASCNLHWSCNWIWSYLLLWGQYQSYLITKLIIIGTSLAHYQMKMMIMKPLRKHNQGLLSLGYLVSFLIQANRLVSVCNVSGLIYFSGTKWLFWLDEFRVSF